MVDDVKSSDAAMTLRAAMTVNRTAASTSSSLTLGIACGFTALHLTSFVEAYARVARPGTGVQIRTGTYGDLVVATGDLTSEQLDGTIVFLEWRDLDPRLSVRRGGTPAHSDDIARTAGQRAGLLRSRIEGLASSAPVVVVGPRLDFPTYFSARAGQRSSAELAVRATLSSLIAEVAGVDNVRVLADVTAAGALSHDAKIDLKADFPYATSFASELARAATTLLLPEPPKKGLITDLDDTLWRGLVGEVGPAGVTWDLDHDSHAHTLYQQLLARLADEGVLIAVASKNDQSIVEDALARPDLVVPRDKLFPVLASWEPKSQSVGAILKAWNIGPGDVVFVDDNPLELAQIASQFPDIATAQFHPHDPRAVIDLVGRLAALFARDGERTAEDALRVASLKAGAEFANQRDAAGDYTSFLAESDADISITFGNAHRVDRAYELVQKTNQFNLNGRRHELAQWHALGARHSSVSATVAYRDKFGELGVISVLSGSLEADTLVVESWVLSCRAFSRAVEHHVLRALFDHLGVARITFDYAATDRNGPVRSFLTGLGMDVSAMRPTLERGALDAEPLASLHRIHLNDDEPAPAGHGG